jgi:hypothetical protein
MSIKEPRVIKEASTTAYSDFLMFREKIDRFDSLSLLAESPEAAKALVDQQDKMFHLAYLRIEMTRVRTGMADFIFRASSPGPDGKSHAVVTIRGNRDFGKPEGCDAAARVIFREMEKRGDASHKWSKANVEYLGNMLFPYCKFFVTNPGTDKLSYTTEALM